ncbi:hypothetical protein BDN70DRAFT_200904 [Pholiota conissans]|uniref:Uncharacterized protein n=1 Tax=Pholiota conissans TaxID=109636 RepID=A0A9P5YXX0_9AGAR|nr:hypothetical protein BDN70DRAFT_200904 [Pholiota conissans]
MAVVVTPDWLHNMDNNRQRTSPANEPSAQAGHPHTPQQQQQQQQQQLLQQQQQQMLLAAQQSGYSYPVQQQPQGSWTPNVTAPPFYPSFYQNHQQQQPQQPYQNPQAPYFDPANAQLAAQWAYQQMMFNAQHGFAQHMSPSQRPPNASQPGQQPTPDYFSQVQIPPMFNPFPSGTPPPPQARQIGDQQGQEYPGYHPYRRPNRQPSSPAEAAAHDRRQGQGQRPGIGQIPHPPYARPDASGSSSSINSSSSQRQRTNSNQSAHSSVHNSPSLRGASPAQSSSRSSPSPVSSTTSTPSPLRQPHIRTGSSSSSASTATTTSSSIRPSPSLATTATSSASASTAGSASSSATPRLTRPSPLSQGNFTASEKRRSRDDIDLGALHSEATPTATMIRSGGLKGRLRRALSFNVAQTLKEEADAEVDADKAEEEEDDDVSIKASQVNGKLKAKATAPPINIKTSVSGTEDEGPMSASTSTASIPVKKKGRAASLFNSRLNASTDNISLSSTVSSASVMIRKLGAMGKLARRNSLAGITSLFKDKDKDKSKDSKEEGSSKGKKKDKDKKTAKGSAAVASVSHVTAELDRPSATGDWSVGAELNGLSPAAKLARQHTLKSNAEAAAKAKEAREKEAKDAATAAAAAAAMTSQRNGASSNGTKVPTWDRNTATRQGSASPVKGGSGIRINEDGTRTLIEEDDEESDDGHYHHHFQERPPHGHDPHADGWDDDEDWDVDGDGEGEEEDVTIRVGMEPRTSQDSAEDERYMYTQAHFPQSVEMEPWAVDVRRSVEKARKPAKGILKRAESYDQQAFLNDPSSLPSRPRSNSYNSPAAQSELGPLARIPSPDPDHIDGLHRHGSHSSGHGPSSSTSSLPSETPAPFLPPLTLDANISRFSTTFTMAPISDDPPDTPTTVTGVETTLSTMSTTSTTVGTRNGGSLDLSHVEKQENRASGIFQHPNFNSSAPALSTMGSISINTPPTLAHRSATSPGKRLTFATNLSVYDTFSASVYDRRSEPATWSRLTPALAQRIKEELNSYKMEEMEVHAASRIHTQFFV